MDGGLAEAEDGGLAEGEIVDGGRWEVEVVDGGRWEAEVVDGGLGESVDGSSSGGRGVVGVCGDAIGTTCSESVDSLFRVATWVLTAEGVTEGSSVRACVRVCVRAHANTYKLWAEVVFQNCYHHTCTGPAYCSRGLGPFLYLWQRWRRL